MMVQMVLEKALEFHIEPHPNDRISKEDFEAMLEAIEKREITYTNDTSDEEDDTE